MLKLRQTLFFFVSSLMEYGILAQGVHRAKIIVEIAGVGHVLCLPLLQVVILIGAQLLHMLVGHFGN